VRGKQIIWAVKASNGDVVAVNEREIRSALKEMHGHGYYIEPTAAVAIAGIKKYLKELKSHEIIVSVFTGHGLKAHR